jgi:hypothetical protein
MDILGGLAGPPQISQPTRLATAATTAPSSPLTGGETVSAGVKSAQVHEALGAYAGAPITAAQVRTTDDYTQLVRQLEQKYPNASGLDINRAVRQHFYSDNGVKNTHEAFDNWLGRDGGHNAAELTGVENDLQGLPSRVTDPAGKAVDLSHMAVGIDAYYNHKTGIHSIATAPIDAAKGFMLTHGGDLGQVFAAEVMAAGNKLGISHGSETFSSALDYASMAELRGNQDGIEMGLDMGAHDRLSAALMKQFH